MLLLAVTPVTADSKRAACIEAQAEQYQISRSLAAETFDAAARHDVPPNLFFAVVHAESGFRPGVVSPVGAVGLAQVMPSTATALRPGLDRWELFSPRLNLDVGAEYLRILLDKYGGDQRRALIAYHRGPTRADREAAAGTGHGKSTEYANQILRP